MKSSALLPDSRQCSCWGQHTQQQRWQRYQQQPQRALVIRPAVDRDLDWDPAIKKGPLTAPPRNTPPPPPPQQPPGTPKTAFDWLEAPFRSRRNIMATLFLGSAAVWVWNKKVLPPVQIGSPPADFPFQLSGYTDVSPDEFVYAKTPGGNWIAAAQDPAGRVFIIDQAGDLYYDSGNKDIGIYALDPQGNLFNIFLDERGQRTITPVGNITDMKKFKVSEIAGIKFERDINVVAMMDGSTIELPPGSGLIDKNTGKYVPPGELIEGLTLDPPDNPFARLFGRQGSGPGYVNRYQVDPADMRDYKRQIFDQTLLDDPDLPGYQPALPRDFSLEDLAREVEAEQQAKARRSRGFF